MRIDHITSSGYSQERGEFTVKYADGTNAYIVGQVAAGDVNFGIGTATPSTNLEVVGAISASGKITGLTGSFSELQGNSPINVGSQMIFNHPVQFTTGSLTITGSLTVSGSSTFNNVGPFSQNGSSTFQGGVTQFIGTQGNMIIDTVGDYIATGSVKVSSTVESSTGSFEVMRLEAPNGTVYKFSVNNDGHLSITGSVV